MFLLSPLNLFCSQENTPSLFNFSTQLKFSNPGNILMNSLCILFSAIIVYSVATWIAHNTPGAIQILFYKVTTMSKHVYSMPQPKKTSMQYVFFNTLLPLSGNYRLSIHHHSLVPCHLLYMSYPYFYFSKGITLHFAYAPHNDPIDLYPAGTLRQPCTLLQHNFIPAQI